MKRKKKPPSTTKAAKGGSSSALFMISVNPVPEATEKVYPCCDDPACRYCHGTGLFDPKEWLKSAEQKECIGCGKTFYMFEWEDVIDCPHCLQRHRRVRKE